MNISYISVQLIILLQQNIFHILPHKYNTVLHYRKKSTPRVRAKENRVQVQVILRPTVSRPVRPGVHDQISICFV
jgi:hypothetical protein